MNNYLEQIEQEFSRARGKQSLLAPIDWQLAQSWEDKQIPVHIVLRAMGDVAKNFRDNHSQGTINTLRYFAPAVEKQHAEWLSSQVGKNIEETTDMNDFAAYAVSDDTDILAYLAEGFDKENLPEPLRSAAAKARAEILALVDETASKPLTEDDIEKKLETISTELDLSLVVSLPEDARARMLETIKRDYTQIKINEDSCQKLLRKMAYEHFGLPKLTLLKYRKIMLEKKGLVKLTEECGELGEELCALLLLKHLARLEKIASKKMTCMDTDIHWDGAGSLKERLENELADVMAAAEIVIKNFGLSREQIIERSNDKFQLFTEWMGEED